MKEARNPEERHEGDRLSTSPYKRHLRRHERSEQHVRFERQVCHLQYCLRRDLRIELLDIVQARARSPVCQAKLAFDVTDVDLTAGYVKLASVERSGFREPGDSVFGSRVGNRVRPWHLGGDRAVIDDAAAARSLAFHEAHGLLNTEKHAGE